jgi:hypothetical protein
MIPVEVTPAPWHYTTFWDWIDHWQTLIAGILAFTAGFGTVVATMIIASRQIAEAGEEADRVTAATRHQTETTVRLEGDRVLNEVGALRKSFALELRLQITRAFEVYVGLRGLGNSDEPITAKIVESKSRMPAPIIFLANAGKIGLLEGDAMDVLVVYTHLEDGQDGVARLITSRTPEQAIPPAIVVGTAQPFLRACSHAQGVLARLKTGDASLDDKDEELIRQIKKAI